MILLWRRVKLLKTNKYKNVIKKNKNWSEGVMVYHLKQEERIQCKLELIVIIWSHIFYLKGYFKRHAVMVIQLFFFLILDLKLRDISHLWKCAFLKHDALFLIIWSFLKPPSLEFNCKVKNLEKYINMLRQKKRVNNSPSINLRKIKFIEKVFLYWALNN